MGLNMKLEIVKMADPADPTNKAARPTLLYGSEQFFKGEMWQIALPMTSNGCQRRGSVLLLSSSPAFKSTGLADGGTIKIASAFRFRVACENSEMVSRTGHWLNTAKDQHFADLFAIASREAAAALSSFESLPVAF